MISRFAICVGAAVLAALVPGTASAQATPGAGSTPGDGPSIKVGMTLFPQFTVQTDPKVTDASGNAVSKNAFDVGRAYINVTGNVSRVVSFRITPDITRESGLLSLAPGNSIPSDSLVFRIKYAYGQFNLDDWAGAGSWVRLGIQQTPWVDFQEGIYRYRFQGTVFAERVPLPTPVTSSDAGVSFHYNLPGNFGDLHAGVYNGENYQKVEVNDQKAFEFRGTIRPFATRMPALRGLRAHIVYYTDHYVADAERRRVMANATYEHRLVNLGFDYLRAKDRSVPAAAGVSSGGYSVWATPRIPRPMGASWEALIRYDHWTPNTASTLAPPPTALALVSTRLSDQHQNRTILGGAYWFPHQGGVSSAILVDWDAQSFRQINATPAKSLAIHGLISF